LDKMIVDEWQKYADNDLKVVHILLGHRPIQVEIVCYHCQQAAEKALKAFLLYNDKEPPKTHSLENLIDLCAEITSVSIDIVGDCEYLNPFGIQPRYPFGLDLTEEDAIIAAQKCSNIVSFVRNKITNE